MLLLFNVLMLLYNATIQCYYINIFIQYIYYILNAHFQIVGNITQEIESRLIPCNQAL